MIGTTLGHFRITGRLGAGGMGEVWRARDERLDREVAIKVLPAEVAGDPERLARFEREARALAALNHQHIATLFGLEEHEGRSFLVMELVEGETLAARIGRGPLAVGDALEVARQVAEGLAAAHERGIVHRDLKPANVMVSPEGEVKVLDFGLAKAWHDGGDAADLADSPTLTAAMTSPGVLLGTAAYMSPEQARGRPVDRRSDAWAFGCLLYECLAGRQAFPGDTVSDTLAAVLTAEPAWEALPEATPEPLRRLLRRCLRKERSSRLDSLRDARLEIEDATREPAAPETLAPSSARRSPWLLPAIACVLVLVAFFSFLAVRPSHNVEDSISYRRLTHQRGGVRSARFAPDGGTIVYSASWEGRPLQLFLRRLDSTEALPVVLEPHHARLLSVSARGELAILVSTEPGNDQLFTFRSGTLARVPLTGGTARAVAEAVHAAEWDPSGARMAVVRGVENSAQLEYPVGTVLHRSSGDIGGVRFDPSGGLLAFFDYPFFNNNRGTVWVVTLDGEARRVTAELENLTGMAWSPDGKEIWFSGTDEVGGALFAVTPSGHLRVLRRSPGDLVLHDASADGRALVADNSFALGIAALVPGEQTERDLSWLHASVVTDISADGKYVLFTRQDVMNYEVWLRRTDGSAPTRLGRGMSFAVSPDGRWAASEQLSTPSTLTLLPTGAGDARSLEGVSGAQYAEWTPDGRYIVWAAAVPDGEVRLYARAVTGGDTRPISGLGIQSGVLHPFRISPDGGWVAAVGSDDRIRLYPIAGGEPREVHGTQPGDEPCGWAVDGESLLVSDRNTLPARVFRLDLESGRRLLWRELMPQDPSGVTSVISVDVTPDGKGYAYSYIRWLDTLYLLAGLE